MSGEPWSNWSGHVRAGPADWRAPSGMEELQAAIRSAPAPVRALGAGHSCAPLIPGAGTVLSFEKFDGFLGHDAAKQQATFGAGIRLGKLTRSLREIGQALANMGDVDKQSLGGALATATHGTGATLGAYHTRVERIEFLDGKGEPGSFSRADNEEMLHAAGVSLGCFGLVTQVTLGNMAHYRLRKRRYVLPIEDMLANFQELMQVHRSAEFYYMPYSGHAMFIASDLTDEPVTSRPTEDDEEGLATLRILRNTLRYLPWLRRKLSWSGMRRLPREDFVEDWFRVYTSERVTRFNEMEYHLPFEEGPKVLAEIIPLTERHFPDVYFPMEVRSVAADEFWLSPFYKRFTCSVAIHHDAASDPTAFFKAAEPIFRRHGGRPHWGKMHGLTAAELSKLYPRWNDAMQVRREIDSDNRFITPYMAQLLGTDRP